MPDSAPLSTARKANAVEPNVTARDVTTGSFPSSRKVHVAGRRHGDLRVAMREIDLEPGVEISGYDLPSPPTWCAVLFCDRRAGSGGNRAMTS